jgi:alkylhydroperoxidase family enzyme
VLEGKFCSLLDYVEKVTLHPSACRREDLDHLRSQGATDEEIHNCVQVAAYFNYINRVADGLGVDLEPEMQEGAPEHLV